jgi:hypothetical protein
MKALPAPVLLALTFALTLAAAPVKPTPRAAPAPAATAAPTPTPQRVLGLIRAAFRARRPPPPYETYTVERHQLATNGYVDPVGSYTYHVWVRNLDRAALKRQVFRDEYRGPLEFDRPAFNEDRDPGPPTADLFQPAPLRPRPVEVVPTPEPLATQLPIIGSTVTAGEYDYRVDALTVEGELVHLKLTPFRDPDRNRIRELWADKSTYQLRRMVATDKLFDRTNKRVFGVVFTATLGEIAGGHLAVTDLHGVVGDGYNDDGREVDFHFRDITFPASLPAWYFDPRSYAAHQNDAPA